MKLTFRLIALCLGMVLPATGAFAQSKPAPTHRYFMTRVNVGDLQKSLDFYTTFIGLKEVRRVPSEDYTEVLLSEDGSDQVPQFVLAYRKGKGGYELGSGFNNMIFVVDDVRATLARIQAAGYQVTAQPKDVKKDLPFATSLTFALVKDPDGYPVELLQWNK